MPDSIMDVQMDRGRLYERIVDRERKWTGRIFSVDTLDVELSDGSHGYREIVNHHGGAGVVAVRRILAAATR